MGEECTIRKLNAALCLIIVARRTFAREREPRQLLLFESIPKVLGNLGY